MLKRSILLNLLIMIAILAGIIYALFYSLNGITNHGKSSKVPPVVGLQLKEALKALDSFRVEVDSVYMPYEDPLKVMRQEPAEGSIVKTGRTIFLTVNKVSPPTIAMPELVNMSFRNAILTLQSYRLVMGDTIFKPNIAAGAVLDQLYNGKSIARGTNVPIGSKIDLIVGAGLSDSIMNVPNLIGVNFATAKSILDAMSITPVVVWEGSITDSNSAIIYKQIPEAKNELDFDNTFAPGDLIDLYILQSPSQELLRMNRPGAARYLDPNDSNQRISYGPPISELSIDSTGKPTIVPGTTTTNTAPKPKPRPKRRDTNAATNQPEVPAPDPEPIIGTKQDVPVENQSNKNPEPVIRAPREPKKEDNPVVKQEPTVKKPEDRLVKKKDPNIIQVPANAKASSKSESNNNAAKQESKGAKANPNIKPNDNNTPKPSVKPKKDKVGTKSANEEEFK